MNLSTKAAVIFLVASIFVHTYSKITIYFHTNRSTFINKNVKQTEK